MVAGANGAPVMSMLLKALLPDAHTLVFADTLTNPLVNGEGMLNWMVVVPCPNRLVAPEGTTQV